MIELFPEITAKTAGEKIRAYRKVFKLSQNQLCELIGISQNNLSAIENGRREVGLQTAVKFCAIFNVNLEDLLFPQGIEKESGYIEVAKRLDQTKTG